MLRLLHMSLCLDAPSSQSIASLSFSSMLPLLLKGQSFKCSLSGSFLRISQQISPTGPPETSWTVILITKLISTLNNSRGFVAEYQELARELISLHNVLLHVDRGCHTNNAQSVNVDLNALYATAMGIAGNFRHSIDAFMIQFQKYESTLGHGGSYRPSGQGSLSVYLAQMNIEQGGSTSSGFTLIHE